MNIIEFSHFLLNFHTMKIYSLVSCSNKQLNVLTKNQVNIFFGHSADDEKKKQQKWWNLRMMCMFVHQTNQPAE